MELKTRNATAIAFVGMLCLACAVSNAKGKVEVVRYPAALRDTWQGEGREYCNHPDAGDSDVRMTIEADKLIDYEQWNEPVSVMRLSRSPQAWKIRSRLHIDEHWSEIDEIFILSGQDSGRLTIVDSSRSMSYARCP